MNRIARMLSKNIFRLPGLYGKLCHYAKHTDKYPEQEKYDHISHIFQLAIRSGNVDLQVHGLENIPQEGGFLMYGNHQGMFDVLVFLESSPVPFAFVMKKEVKDVILLKASRSMHLEEVASFLEKK